MKKMILLFPVIFILSCNSESVEQPTAHEKNLLNQVERSSISSIIDRVSADKENSIEIISPSSFSHEQFELLKYIVPLLHDRQKLSIGFWFLKGNSDEEIQGFLQNDAGALTSSELLFNSDPILCGYEEYVDFLEYLKDFYSEIINPEEMHITGKDNAFLTVTLYGNRSEKKQKIRFLIHAPLFLGNNRWQLPFAGKIYNMMIHEWKLDQYCGINLKDSFLSDHFLTNDDKEHQQKVSEQFDYLVIAGIPESYEDFLPIESFINESNISEALNYFPGQIIREKVKPAIYLVQKKITKNQRKASRELLSEYTKIYEMFPNSR